MRVRFVFEAGGEDYEGDQRELLDGDGWGAIFWSAGLAHMEEQRIVVEARGRVDGRRQPTVAHSHRYGFECNAKCELWDWPTEPTDVVTV